MHKEVIRLQAKAKKLSFVQKTVLLSDNELACLLRKSSDGFLFSQEWKEVKKLVKEKYGLNCLCCGRENSRKFPINIDHIKPRKFYPELSLDIDNLQPLCGPCNKRKGNKVKDFRIHPS